MYFALNNDKFKCKLIFLLFNCYITFKQNTEGFRKRTESLQNQYKIFTNILRCTIRPSTENIVRQYQGGFRTGRSKTDQLSQAMQRYA